MNIILFIVDIQCYTKLFTDWLREYQLICSCVANACVSMTMFSLNMLEHENKTSHFAANKLKIKEVKICQINSSNDNISCPYSFLLNKRKII